MRARVLVPVVAVFAAGLICSIEAASNSFATATGEGVVTTGDTSFGVKNPTGPVEVTVTPRSGWGLPSGEGSQTVNHQPGTIDVVPLAGKDGEESQPITIGDVYECQHSLTSVSKHWTDSAAIVVATPYILGLYSDPKDGVPVNPSYTYEVRKPTHKVDYIRVPCPNPKCTWGQDGEIEKSDIVTNGVAVIELPVTIKKDGKSFDGLVLPYGQYSVECGVALSNECRQCCGGGSTNTLADIYKVDIVSEPYIGLDRTDEGRKTNIVKKARTIWTGGKPETVTMEWKTESTCQAASSHKEEPFEYRPKDHDTPSPCFMGDYIQCKVDIEQKGAKASSTPSNSFTVVKVDVQIGEDDNEETEETDGYNLYYIPDAKNGEWTEEGTNGLVEVSISCAPDDGAMAEQSVTIDAKDDFLFVKLADDKYEKAKKSYRVKELKDTKFVLHGHAKSDKYLGEEIRVTHPVSGAIDVAKFTVFGRPYLVPDYDRKNGIDDKDIETAKAGETTFRFWINDDNDSGDLCPGSEYNTDYPGLGKANCENKKVDGRRDLLDFTPLWLDIADVFPKGTPPELKGKIKWELKPKCVNVVWTQLTKKRARTYHYGELHAYGKSLNKYAFEAEVVKDQSTELPDDFYKALLEDEEFGMVLIEGAQQFQGDDAVVLEGVGITKEPIKGSLKASISSIKDMYRMISVRPAGKNGEEEVKERDGDPVNRPQQECDGKNIVFVHGYNVNPTEAESNASEVFKRLWQSGSESMFTAITWRGDEQQFNTHVVGTASLNYYINVHNAFEAAPLVAQKCAALPGTKIVIGHSLGNMLVSSAIVDHKLQYAKYFIMDGAVAISAYDSEEYSSDMIDSAWENVNPSYRASRWYELFDETDFRHTLSWKGRFAGIKNVINCYSKTEDVVGDPVEGGRQSVWVMQEWNKGCNLWHVLNFGPHTSVTVEGGWGITTPYCLDPRKYFLGFNEEVKNVTKEVAITRPLFTPFRRETERMHSLQPYFKSEIKDPDGMRSLILGDGIPAESHAVGANLVKCFEKENINMMDYASNTEKWPDDRKDDEKMFWHHSDIKNLAYFYNYKLYDEMVKRIEE